MYEADGSYIFGAELRGDRVEVLLTGATIGGHSTHNSV
jgi:hypothetical protein